MSRLPIWAALIALAISLGAGAVMIREAKALRFAARPLADQAALMRAGAALPGLSRAGRAAWLAPCLQQAHAPELRLAPQRHRTALAGACANHVARLPLAARRSGEAQLALALAHEAQGARGAMIAALIRARAAAPRVGWLAVQRADLAAREIAALDAPGLAALRGDLALMASDFRLVPLLPPRARHWGPAPREVLIAAVETAPGPQQRMFLNQMREATR